MSKALSFARHVRQNGVSAALQRTGYILQRSVEKQLLMRLPRGAFWDGYFAFLHFRLYHGRNPRPGERLFNDHLYTLKISGELDDPLRTFVTDKEFVKLFVAGVVGDDYNVPTIAVLRSPQDVRRYEFPARCCIKSTHGTGHTIIRRSGEPLDVQTIIGWFSYDHYQVSGEQNYKRLRPKVIVEPLIFGNEAVEDYKIFCFDGQPRLIQVDIGRFTNHTRKLFTTDWVDTRCSIGYPVAEVDVPRPRNLDEMLTVARALSQHFRSIRVDLYTDGEQVLVGELTSCHGGAAEPFIPPHGEAVVSRICFGKV